MSPNAYGVPYPGFLPLKQHFFPVIGNLKDSGESVNFGRGAAQ